MSKYIKLEDAIEKCKTIAGAGYKWLSDLPTIEVSEDCISRYYVRLIESDEDAYYGDWNETYEKGFSDAIDKVLNAPSVVPKEGIEE